MIQISENIKRTRVKEELAKRIVNGEFAFGERFPGLHEISREYEVSYVTASKAVKLLEEEGYLRGQDGIGRFVCYVRPDQVTTEKNVNIIVAPDFYASYPGAFSAGEKLFRENGWNVNLMQIDPGELYSLVPHINSPDAYSILCAFNVNWERFAATFGHVVKRVIVLGKLSGNPEITSIVADEYETIRLCMRHFAEMGRKRIALICARPSGELELLRIAAWRTGVLQAGMSPEWARRHCLSLDLETNSDAPERIFKVCQEWLRDPLRDVDGIILPCTCKEFLAACAAQNVTVPDQLPAIYIGQPEIYASLYPQLAILDNNFYGHFQCALEILEDRFRSGKTSPGSWYFCQPERIIPSASSRTIKPIQRRIQR